MPYKAKSDLPDNVRNVLPAHARDIYKEAFNSAWEQYKDKADRRDDASREETAHKVARAAVKNDYEKARMINGIRKINAVLLTCWPDFLAGSLS